MLRAHAGKAGGSTTAGIAQGRRDGVRRQQQKGIGLQGEDVGRGRNTRRWGSSSGIGQRVPRRVVAGRKWGGRKGVAGTRHLAPTDLGTRHEASALGLSRVGAAPRPALPRRASSRSRSQSPRWNAAARSSSSVRPARPWCLHRASSMRGTSMNNFQGREASGLLRANPRSLADWMARRAKVSAADRASRMNTGTSCSVATGCRSSADKSTESSARQHCVRASAERYASRGGTCGLAFGLAPATSGRGAPAAAASSALVQWWAPPLSAHALDPGRDPGDRCWKRRAGAMVGMSMLLARNGRGHAPRTRAWLHRTLPARRLARRPGRSRRRRCTSPERREESRPVRGRHGCGGRAVGDQCRAASHSIVSLTNIRERVAKHGIE